jgi:hypothetical protein
MCFSQILCRARIVRAAVELSSDDHGAFLLRMRKGWRRGQFYRKLVRTISLLAARTLWRQIRTSWSSSGSFAIFAAIRRGRLTRIKNGPPERRPKELHRRGRRCNDSESKYSMTAIVSVTDITDVLLILSQCGERRRQKGRLVTPVTYQSCGSNYSASSSRNGELNAQGNFTCARSAFSPVLLCCS